MIDTIRFALFPTFSFLLFLIFIYSLYHKMRHLCCGQPSDGCNLESGCIRRRRYARDHDEDDDEDEILLEFKNNVKRLSDAVPLFSTYSSDESLEDFSPAKRSSDYSNLNQFCWHPVRQEHRRSVLEDEIRNILRGGGETVV